MTKKRRRSLKKLVRDVFDDRADLVETDTRLEVAMKRARAERAAAEAAAAKAQEG